LKCTKRQDGGVADLKIHLEWGGESETESCARESLRIQGDNELAGEGWMRRRKLACDVDAAGAQQDANIPTQRNATQNNTGASTSTVFHTHTSQMMNT
jgi:hypothetical protein